MIVTTVQPLGKSRGIVWRLLVVLSILPSSPTPGTDTDSRCMEIKSISVKLFSPGKAKAIDFNLMGFFIIN